MIINGNKTGWNKGDKEKTETFYSNKNVLFQTQ